MRASIQEDAGKDGDVPMLLRMNEAAQELGLSRAKLYQLLAEGALESVKVGTARRIPSTALAAYVEKLQADSRSRA